MIANVAHHILALHGWLALAIVFAVPALESSAFVGFVFPGETAVLLGGVLAFEHRVSLAGVLAAGIAGAVVGDSIGYAVGRRWGRALLHGSIGRFVKRAHLDRAERYLAERGGKAVFFGRFTAALRAMIPGLAGMARMRYRTFVGFNVAGGAAWATENVVLGYLAGTSWRHVERVASRVGLAMLALLVLALATSLVIRAAVRRSERLHAVGDRLARTPPAAWSRRRFPAQVSWLRQRLDVSRPTGFALTIIVVIGGLCAWSFAGVTQDVAAHEEVVRLDPGVEQFAVAHRTALLNRVMPVLTFLGSSHLLIPLVAVLGLLWWWRGRRWRPTALLTAAFVGALVLQDVVKLLVKRPRPRAPLLGGPIPSWAYPSLHVTQAIATWGMLAVILAAGRSLRTRLLLAVSAAVVAFIVGVTRIYLGAHWFTDVLGGYALGGAWLSLLLALSIVRTGTASQWTWPSRQSTTDLAGTEERHGSRPAEPGPAASTTGTRGTSGARVAWGVAPC